jgi:hypothetical protein
LQEHLFCYPEEVVQPHQDIVNSLLAELGAPVLSASNTEECSDDFEHVRRLVVGR